MSEQKNTNEQAEQKVVENKDESVDEDEEEDEDEDLPSDSEFNIIAQKKKLENLRM